MLCGVGVVGFGTRQQCDCLCVQGRQKTVYLQHRTSTHSMTANDVCVSVFKSCKGAKKKGEGEVGKSSCRCKDTQTASFSSLTSAVSLLFIVVCVIVDIFKGGLSVFEFGGFMD